MDSHAGAKAATCLVLLALSLGGCASGPAASDGARAPTPGAGEQFYVVDCLLPAQIRKLGRALTYLAPRRAVKTSAVDCEIRGGEYVSYDRADYATALKVWLPLAQEGDKVAQTYVGEIYEKGLGVLADHALAAAWYRKAAAQGHSRAQINLGHLYEKGLGVERDLATALDWYRRASGLVEGITIDTATLANDVRSELARLRDEAAGRRDEAAGLRQQLEDVRRDLQDARRELDRRTADAEAERQRVEQARRDVERARQEARALAGAQARSQAEARVRDLEAALQQRQAELDQQRQETTRWRDRVAALEREATDRQRAASRSRDDRVAMAGPSIEMIEPNVVMTRGVSVVKGPYRTATERLVVGRVTAPGGLLALTVNDREETVDGNGLFRARIPVPQGGGVVKVVAVDRLGKRGDVEFRFAPDESEAPQANTSIVPQLRVGAYHALIIGNRSYRHWPSLKTAVTDATRTAELLREKYGFTTRVLIDAKRYDILQALNDLRNQLTEEDNLLIYYAGHGYLDEKINRAYWIPVEGALDSNADWIPTVALTDLVGAMSAKHILVVADSCYAGALTRSALARLEAGMTDEARRHWFEVVASKRSRTILSSGDLKPVLDTGGGEHSVFARAWLDALRRNEDILEGQRLHREIAARVAYAADALKFEQIPQYAPIRFAGHEAGDFLFVPRGRWMSPERSGA